MSFLLGVVLLAMVTAVACALPGVFVVLRRDAMLVDAISHAVLPGIVVGYLLTRDLDSPLVILGAALSGLVVVLGSELLERTGLLTGDAPNGLIFPALFSVGILLITSAASKVHLDTHAVLVGDLNLAAFDHLTLAGLSIGPRYLYVMVAVLLLNLVALLLARRVLTLTTFDRDYARSLGVRTGRVNAAFMFLVSLTITAAFNAAGAILVVALVVAPPATAALLCTRVTPMIWTTAGVAAGGALLGFSAAYLMDAATSAGMAVVYGLIFLAALAGSRWHRRHLRGRASPLSV